MAQETWATLPTPPASTGGRYVSKFEGTTKYRITGFPSVYWEYFNNSNKPVRSKDKPADTDFKANAKVGKHGQQLVLVWALPAWDYQQEKHVALQLKKRSLIDGLHRKVNDPDRGDPTKYDIKITKEGKDLETKYFLEAIAPKELSDEIKEEIKNNPVSVHILIDNGDPFQELDTDLPF